MGTVLLVIVPMLVAGWVVPWLGMRLVTMPKLLKGPKAANYRGRPVALGLGRVWLWWSGGVAAMLAASTAAWFGVEWFEPALVTSVLLVWASPAALLLIPGTFFLGRLDDEKGDATARGFKGHVSELLAGHVTTGMWKVLGIGVLSLLAAAVQFGGEVTWTPVAILLRGAVIALSANLVNLLDLRPGRALKGYSFLVLAFAFVQYPIAFWGRPGAWALDIAPLLVLLLGPVVAVWRYDLGEVAMLGDAGANPAGALGGYALASALPLPALAAAAAVLLALNLASERVSFSKVIEGNRFLHRLDMLGRGPLAVSGPNGTMPKDDGEQREA